MRSSATLQHLGNIGIGNFIDQTIAAQHIPGTNGDRECVCFNIDLGINTQRTGNNVATRVRARLIYGNNALINKLLYVTVVFRQTRQCLFMPYVHARVAHVRHHNAVVV